MIKNYGSWAVSECVIMVGVLDTGSSKCYYAIDSFTGINYLLGKRGRVRKAKGGRVEGTPKWEVLIRGTAAPGGTDSSWRHVLGIYRREPRRRERRSPSITFPVQESRYVGIGFIINGHSVREGEMGTGEDRNRCRLSVAKRRRPPESILTEVFPLRVYRLPTALIILCVWLTFRLLSIIIN